MPPLKLVALASLLAASIVAVAAPLKVVVDGKATELSDTDVRKLTTHDLPVKQHDGTVMTYEGPLLADVLAKAGVQLGDHVKGKALATYILAKASDGYQVLFSIGEVEPSIADRSIVLAYKTSTGDLIASDTPYRIVIEGDKKQAREIRMVTELDVVTLKT